MIQVCWQSMVLISWLAGAKYPNLVAAQSALESGWGQSTSGTYNYFGIKGAGTSLSTQEYINGQVVTITDNFKNYNSPEDSVQDLVDKWYKDYNGYKGVNRANSRDDAARMLSAQGYATSPNYASKLISLMNRYSVAVPNKNLSNDKAREPYRCS